jgi:hypothetical protein
MATLPQAESTAEHLDVADMRRRIRAIFVGSVGNLVEWNDVYAYTAFSLYFASAFFPKGNEVVQQLNAALDLYVRIPGPPAGRMAVRLSRRPVPDPRFHGG